jgi:hypothetical protein
MIKNEKEIDQELDAVDHGLSGALVSARNAEAHRDIADQSLYDALFDIYSVWHPLVNKEYLIVPFCERHNLSTHSKLKSRFLAPVQHCFRGKKSRSSHTHYATALQMAEEEGISPSGLVRWLELNEGPSGLYTRTLSERKKPRPSPHYGPLPAAQPNPVSPMRAGSAATQAPWPAAANDAAFQPQLAASPHRAQPELSVLALIEACETIHDLTLRAGKDRHYVLRNVLDTDGKWKCRIENVASTTHTPFAQLTLPYALDLLDSREYLLRGSEHKRLLRVYSSRASWHMEADDYEFRIVDEGGHFEIVAPRLTTAACEDLYRLREPLNHGVALTCTKERARKFLKWQAQMRGFLKAHNEQVSGMPAQLDAVREFRRKFPRYREGYALWERSPLTPFVKPKPAPQSYPRALDLTSCTDRDEHGNVEHYLELHHCETSNLPFVTPLDTIRCRLFEATAPISINRDIRLDVREMQQACALIGGQTRLGAEAQLVGYEEAQSGLTFEIALPDARVRFLSPTVLSQSGLHRQCSQALSPSSSPQPFVPNPPSASQVALPAEAAKLVEEQFAGYIICSRPGDEAMWIERREHFLAQLERWLDRTVVPLFLRLSGWSQDEVNSFDKMANGILQVIKENGGDVDIVPAASLVANRVECLKDFYARDATWGIMMDDAAVLHEGPENDSSYRLFAEMAVNGPDAYQDVDVFFPLDPRKMPFDEPVNGMRQGVLVKPENARQHRFNHVFDHDLELTSRMFVVRNFRLAGKEVVLPDAGHTLQGEGAYFALLATSKGYKVRRCNNIHLRELTVESGGSMYRGSGQEEQTSARKEAMRASNIELSHMFKGQGFPLRLWKPCDPTYFLLDEVTGELSDKGHLLYTRDIIRECLGGNLQTKDVPKPY